MSSLPLWASGVIGTAIFFILMFLRMHVGLSLMVSGFIGFVMTRGWKPATGTLATTIFETSTSPILVVIPLFIVMGVLAGAGGPIADAFKTFDKWVGHFRGGLAMAAVGSCAAFGAVCGDNIATAMVMDRAALPQMRQRGYADTLSFGAIAAGGNLGILIPPSAAFVVYGFITETPIADLFIAGIIPGLLLTLMMMGQIAVQCRIKPSLSSKYAAAGWRERVISLKGLIGILIGFVLVMGGLMTGWFTPQEAGAIGAFVILLVSLPYRQLSFKVVGQAFLDATKTTAMILLLIFGARYFSYFLTSTEVALGLSNAILGAGLHGYVVMIMVSLVLLVLGCLMDIWSVMIITMPIFFPILMDMGFSPLQLG